MSDIPTQRHDVTKMVVAITTEDLIFRLRSHVRQRGAPHLPNGAWALMLEAANKLEELAKIERDDRWRHKKRGTTYRVIGPGRAQCADAIHDMAEIVIYRADVDGSLWVRPWREFYDGRFERIPRSSRGETEGR